MSTVPQILAVVLFSLGCLCLSALMLTVNASESVPRHPVFVNFLRTWLLWSSYMLFISVAGLVNPTYELDTTLVTFQTCLRDILWMSTQVSTLNLVIHMWVKMKIHGKPTPHSETKLTFALVATPYIFGLVAVIELFPLPIRQFSNRVTLPVDLVLGCLFLAVTAITLLCDVALLIAFWHDRRVLRQANVHGIMSLSMLTRFLILCLYQLVLTVFCGILLTIPNKIPTTLIPVAESLYPLLVFFLVGLRQDILQTWFPCFKEAERPVHTLHINFDVSVVNDIDGSLRSQAQLVEQEKRVGLRPVV